VVYFPLGNFPLGGKELAVFKGGEEGMCSAIFEGRNEVRRMIVWLK
jgi:hypothetical protein